MPTVFAAQNGAVIKRSTLISVSGCPKPLTHKQKLAKAMKACKKKHGQAKRASCERAARKRFTPEKAKKGMAKKR
jgi:hypothetical protein